MDGWVDGWVDGWMDQVGRVCMDQGELSVGEAEMGVWMDYHLLLFGKWSGFELGGVCVVCVCAFPTYCY